MKIGLISDCHLESDGDLDRIYQMLPEKGAVDLYVIAGDATRGEWVTELCKRVRDRLGCQVLFVPGNHEYYYTHTLLITMAELEKSWQAEFSKEEGIHYLQSSSIEIDGIAFYGSTWWSNFKGMGWEYVDAAIDKACSIPDYRYINFERVKKIQGLDQDYFDFMPVFNKITPHDQIGLNLIALKNYKRWYIANKGKKRVLISHFPMLKALQHPAFPPSAYFVSADDSFIEQLPPDLIIYGHTHANVRTTVSGVPCVCNQYGYKSEQLDFDKDFYITL